MFWFIHPCIVAPIIHTSKLGNWHIKTKSPRCFFCIKYFQLHAQKHYRDWNYLLTVYRHSVQLHSCSKVNFTNTSYECVPIFSIINLVTYVVNLMASRCLSKMRSSKLLCRCRFYIFHGFSRTIFPGISPLDI